MDVLPSILVFAPDITNQTPNCQEQSGVALKSGEHKKILRIV